MRPLVYVAGPYTTGDCVWNTHDAIKIAEQIEALGVDVVIPHLSLLWHIVSPAPYQRWLDRDLAVMHRCDALVRLQGKSSGADNEVKEFTGPVFYWPDDIERFGKWVAENG